MIKKLACVAFALTWMGCAAGTTRTAAPVRAKNLSAREQPMAPRAIVSLPPPPARAEPPRPASPGGSAIWRGGHYQFRNGRYLWIAGAWVNPPRPGLIWVPGFYQKTAEGGLFINGHWRKG